MFMGRIRSLFLHSIKIEKNSLLRVKIVISNMNETLKVESNAKHSNNNKDNSDSEIPQPSLVPSNYRAIWSKSQKRFYFVDEENNKSWETPVKPKLPKGWRYRWDKSSSKFYFWNTNVNNGKIQWKYPTDSSVSNNKKEIDENSKIEARNHLRLHQEKYNESIEQQIKDIEEENKRLRREFNEKWDEIDQAMEDEKMEVFDCGDNLSQDYINRLHNQCDEKVDDENILIMNENESLDIFFGEKMEEWMKWVDVYNNRKNSNDTRPLWKVLAEDYPVPKFNSNDYEYEEMMKHSWYEEWENSLKESLGDV